jgi:glycosyltransferase involved in cell wall biosynthesis
MRSTSSVFSHQIENAVELSKYFEKVIVLTGDAGSAPGEGNVHIRSYNWIPGNKATSAIRFLLVFMVTMVEFRPRVIFSHMTEVQSTLISPITRMLGIKHFLWFAHAHKSIYLQWCHLWCNGIITSTQQSCPISGKKIHYVGQSINLDNFKRVIFDYESVEDYVHVGRLDKSKNIDMIIESFLSTTQDKVASLTFIGDSSTSQDRCYIEEIKLRFNEHISGKRIAFLEGIPRKLLPEVLANFDCFLHAFKGSLDKAVLEATAVGLPVITVNSGFLEEFSSWGAVSSQPNLIQEILAFTSLSPNDRATIMNNRVERVISQHSIGSWGVRVSKILLGKSQV